MADNSSTLSISLQSALDRLQAGDDTARAELTARPIERLRHFARSLLRGSPQVHRWEETDDLLQNAAVRLWQALRNTRPRTTAEFFGLAGVCLRRELIDMTRKLYGPEGVGANHASRAGETGDSRPPKHAEPADDATDPGELANWTEFHECVGQLPEADRVLFDLLWYQGVSQPEAAAVLGVDERTIRRRWRAARARVYTVLNATPSE